MLRDALWCGRRGDALDGADDLARLARPPDLMALQPHRRAVLRRLAVLGVGAGGLYLLRRQMLWPEPQVAFAQGDWSGWMRLPLPGGLIDLPARVRGHPVRAVVDSGAQFSAIDADLARRLDLPAATPIPMLAFGVSGGPSLTRAVTLDADLGSFSLKGLRAAALGLHPLSRLTRQPFSLLLGRDFLRAVVVDADFPGARAAFHAPASWRPPPTAQAVPIAQPSGALMVQVAIEAAPPVEVMLDTGATGALALSEAAARAAGLLDGRPLRRGASITLGGVGEDGVATAREIAFAGHRLRNVEVQVYRPAAHAPVPEGLLGLGVLQRFRLALDLSRRRLFLLGRSGGV
jgi:predicted aspartyl protease